MSRGRDGWDDETTPPMAGAVALRGTDLGGYLGMVLAGRYRVLDEVGVGASGVLFLVEDVDTARRFALKVLFEKPRAGREPVETFLQEARLTSRIDHPSVVNILDVGRTPLGSPFYVMDYVDGPDLRTRIDQDGPVPAAAAREITLQICRAIEAAHARGVVHCDLRPENILLAREREGGPEIPRILDLGISKLVARLVEGRRRDTGIVLGTPWWMSPEQAIGADPDQRSDIYTVGCLLYELLTGTLPFRGANAMAILKEQMLTKAELPSRRAPHLQIPADLEVVALQALERRPSGRFSTMKDMAEALARCGGPARGVVEVVRALHLAIQETNVQAAFDVVDQLVPSSAALDLAELAPHLWLVERVYTWACGDLSRVLIPAGTPDHRDPQVMYLLSRLDGSSTIADVLDTCGMPHLVALRLVAKLLHDRALVAR